MPGPLGRVDTFGESPAPKGRLNPFGKSPLSQTKESKAPGPTAFKFKAAKGFKMGGIGKPKPAAPAAMFAQSGRESPEPEEAAPVPKSTTARAGLAAGLAAATEATGETPDESAKAVGLAAAQAIANRISASMPQPMANPTGAATGAAAAAVAPASTPFTPTPPLKPPSATDKAAEVAADADAEMCDAAEAAAGGEIERGGYIFGRRYNRATEVALPAGQSGCQSIDVYENLGVVGRGAFNKIYKARHRTSGQVVALKSMQLAALAEAGQVQGDEGIPLEMTREMSILLSLRHPNIVTVFEVVTDASQMFMVMELVDFDLGLLIEHMKTPFYESQVKCLAMQLLSALAAVHESFVLHRDLKQTNLLLDKNGVLKLCDFGLARRAGTGPSGSGGPGGGGGACTPNVTSLWYRAPEILLGESSYGSAVDMWSFGCIMAEWLQLGEPLVMGTGDLDQINGIFKLLGTPSEQSWPQFSSLKVVQSATLPFVENHTISLGPDGALCKLPKNLLRKRLPAEGYTPEIARAEAQAAQAAQAAGQPAPPCAHKTTALSDSGYDLLNSMLTCDPQQRGTASAALEHSWFKCEPLPMPLSRAEIRMLRRQRDDAIASGAHQQAIAQQRAHVASKVAAEQAAAIAASIRERMGLPS